ncbi:flagellar M-ring protein [Noviherbaspirillum aridicola]|uniref:Flagellar M-ring protein n=2 Tax=Noviherbaspirillum aridicola TaxID=2849687 RepID=A0ABQ4Q6Q6_9BURK|nr:flagellar basal-body MS-ring/collar protein FliF [Noviherbaspirillum aridicola]GIZ52686.1 flagellar M-ring protein [Noviherbaspirillum aridicola]
MTPAGEGAVTVPATPPSGLIGFAQTPGGKNFFLMLGVAAVLAVMAGVWLWSQTPDYRVLFSNFSDRDGGAIVAALQQQNVPYKFAEGGTAILVPADKVHDARLKLAAQGLPKASGVGFELMENQKLGISQFLEQVNFQRALEGELARSIQSVAAVQAARVHLAMPKASVFVRDQQKPTASVLLNLHPGRTLDPQQVSAIVHLVASSVPELSTKNVTVVDQNGTLLSENGKQAGMNGLDPTQLKYVQELQQNIVRRIESILTPIVGAANVRAEATADVDFSHSEQAAEVYTPNGQPTNSAIRSQQTSENVGGGAGVGGIPGALTNQPQPNATAPVNAPANAAPGATAPGAAPAQATGSPPSSVQRESTVNYEVDKTVRYVQQPMGGIKRLSVAVVVNYRKEVGKDGKVTMKPLSEAEKAQIADLVREAMGYNKDRGDTLNVVNSPFAGLEKEVLPEIPFWQRPEMIDLALVAAKWLVAAAVLAYLFFGVLRPLTRRIIAPYLPPPPAEEKKEEEEGEEQEDAVVQIANQAEQEDETPKLPAYLNNLEAARKLARDDPKVVANIVKSWVENE